MKDKFRAILKAIEYLKKFEEMTGKFFEEDRLAIEKSRKETNSYERYEEDCLVGVNPDVLLHHIP